MIMKKSNIELKPCPFCEHTRYLVMLVCGTEYQIVCDKPGVGGCGLRSGWYNSIEDAKKFWNSYVDKFT